MPLLLLVDRSKKTLMEVNFERQDGYLSLNQNNTLKAVARVNLDSI